MQYYIQLSHLFLFLSWFLLLSSWRLNRNLMSLHWMVSFSGTETLFCHFCGLSIRTCSVGDRKFPMIISSLGSQYSSVASSLYRSNSKWFRIVLVMLTVTEHGIPPLDHLKKVENGGSTNMLLQLLLSHLCQVSTLLAGRFPLLNIQQ